MQDSPLYRLQTIVEMRNRTLFDVVGGVLDPVAVIDLLDVGHLQKVLHDVLAALRRVLAHEELQGARDRRHRLDAHLDQPRALDVGVGGSAPR